MKRAGLFWGGWVVVLLMSGFALQRRFDSRLETLWTLPSFEFPGITATGPARAWRSSDFVGRPWIASFIYSTCAGPCPLVSGRMAQLQKVLPENVSLVSFTVDPERDTLPVLQAYAARFDADPKRWIFVRPPVADLPKLAIDGFRTAVARDPAGVEGFRVIHSTKLILVDRKGRVRRFYSSEMENVADAVQRDLRILNQEPV